MIEIKFDLREGSRFKHLILIEQSGYGIKQLNDETTIYVVITRNEDRLVELLKGWSSIHTPSRLNDPSNADLVALTKTSPEDAVKAMEELSDRVLNDLRQRLVSVDPPADAADETESLATLTAFCRYWISQHEQ